MQQKKGIVSIYKEVQQKEWISLASIVQRKIDNAYGNNKASKKSLLTFFRSERAQLSGQQAG